MSGRETTHTESALALVGLPSGRTVETTVHRYEGPREGPTVHLQALQHGGEVNGAEVLRRLHDRLLEADLAGTVVAIPVANPLAFDHRVYMGPTRLDAINTNMNRLWPGDHDGTLMERMVAALWDVVSEADAVVDLHTGGPYMQSHVRFTPGDERSRSLATAFGIDPIVADGDPVDGDGQDAKPASGGAGDATMSGGASTTGGAVETRSAVQERSPGKLRAVAAAAGVPAITPELAHSREIVEPSVADGVAGVENVLRTLDLLDADPDPADPTVARDNSPVHTPVSGLFRSGDVSVGEEVTAGTEIGRVLDPARYEHRATIEAEHDGLLLSLNRGSTVMEGESVASIARPD